MESFINILQNQWNIDLLIVVIVLISGFFQQKYLCTWPWSKDEKHDAALKTLVVSFAASLIYILLQHNPQIPWAKYFVSYFFATSLYELLIRPFRNFIAKATGDDNDFPQAEPPNQLKKDVPVQ